MIPVQANHRLYSDYHERILKAVDTCLPVEKVCSIDEMACRLMGTERQVPVARELALKVKRALREQVGECLTCSIGIAPNVFLGKVGSDLQKPDGLVVITKEDLPEILLGLELQEIYGIGARMEQRLHRAGILTVAELWNATPLHLRRVWGGINGVLFHQMLHGVDIQPPSSRFSKSIGHQHVLEPDLRTKKGAHDFAQHLLTKAAERLRRGDYYCRRLGVHLSWVADLGGWWDETDFHETRDTGFLLARLEEIWQRVPRTKPLSVGVVLLDLVPADQHQPDLFAADNRPAPETVAARSTASTTATAAARSASACFRPTCGRSRAMPPFTGCRRVGVLAAPPACAAAVLGSSYVWTRPPFLRCQRDQDRVRHSAGAADAEFSAELERGADRSGADRLFDAKDGGRSLEVMRWGLIPYWAKDIKIGFSTINARAEEVETKPAFREAFGQRRCLVPVDSFYEWKKTAAGKQPYAIALKDRRLMGIVRRLSRRHHLVQHDPGRVGCRQRGRAGVFHLRSSASRRRGCRRVAADRAQGAAGRIAVGCRAAPALQRLSPRPGPGVSRAGLQAGARGHRLETRRCGLRARQPRHVAQGQMPLPRGICRGRGI